MYNIVFCDLIIYVGSTTSIVTEIEVSQPNHFLRNHQHADNQKKSRLQAEAKFCCCGSIVQQAQQHQGDYQSKFDSVKAGLELEVYAGWCAIL